MTIIRAIFKSYKISPISVTHLESLHNQGPALSHALLRSSLLPHSFEHLVALPQLIHNIIAEHLSHNLQNLHQLLALHVRHAEAFHQQYQQSTIEHVVSLNELHVLTPRHRIPAPRLEERRPALHHLCMKTTEEANEEERGEFGVGLCGCGEEGELPREEEEERCFEHAVVRR